MSIKIMVLERAVKWLVGGDLFKFIVEAVETVNNEEIDGEAKRALVLQKAKVMFSGILTMFMNLAIEVAVISLRARIEDGR